MTNVKIEAAVKALKQQREALQSAQSEFLDQLFQQWESAISANATQMDFSDDSDYWTINEYYTELFDAASNGCDDQSRFYAFKDKIRKIVEIQMSRSYDYEYDNPETQQAWQNYVNNEQSA